MKPGLTFSLLFLLLTASVRAALGDARYVRFAPEPGALAVLRDGAAARIVVDEAAWPGVVRAARDLQADVERVGRARPELEVVADGSPGPKAAADLVLVGTLGRSPLIDRLVRERKLDVAGIRGKWESGVSEVVVDPLPGVARALVIAGSDKRGTIYGIYDLSEEIGVSPWYWWADVPVTPRADVFVAPGRRVWGEPAVKYRGIFLNDEAPALTGWAREKFGGFNHRFYAHVFELILRLRANYLWPAMWLPSAFIDDDPRNAPMADEWGIVMGTTHHEPMMRAHDEWRRFGRGPWDYARNDAVLREFWRGGVERVKNYEGIVSLGMRGDGDSAMSEETNTALLERIVADQRKILAEVTGRPPGEVPQLWALYKEVQGYYERGLRVPDDVTLLWCDDNWGNIRRLPTPAEKGRAGGAGVYYHFDYVGGPRNYRWLNTYPLAKIWEQMHLAWRHEANRIWIVNVGDLKPMEVPTEFFLRMAWDPARWPHQKLGEYLRLWAEREFDAALAPEIAALVDGYTRLNGRRKPEMLAPETYSLIHYREAERVLDEWRDLVARAGKVETRLPAGARDAFFQLVKYPVEASANLHELYVAVGLNRLYAKQGRVAARTQAARARACFTTDGALAAAYHRLGDGRWNHMMAQVKLGYTTWQQPDIETMPAVSEVRPRAGASLAVAIEGSELAWPSYNAPRAVLPPLDGVGGGSRWIEVFNRGDTSFRFQATAGEAWVRIRPASGTLDEMLRLEVDVDGTAVPAGKHLVAVTVTRDNGERVTIDLPVIRPRTLPASDFAGFVESDRHLAIEAPHFSRAVGAGDVSWQTLAAFGRTLGGVTTFPVTAPAQTPGPEGARLEYAVHLHTTGELTVDLQCAPSLDFQSGDGLQLAVSFDDAPPQVVKLATWATLQTWEQAVGDGVRVVTTRHRVDRPGPHVLKVWRVTPGVVLQRIVIDAGGVRPSYLGPPESLRIGLPARTSLPR